MENEKEQDAEGKQQSHNILVYSQTPKPIVVEAENFQNLVQSLTGGKRKRRSVVFAAVNVEEGEAPQESLSQPLPVTVPIQPLLDYLDRLDQECPPPSTGAGANRGFFATVGLVKGVKLEDGLQQFDMPESPQTPVSSSPPNFEPRNAGKTEKASTTVCVHSVTPLSTLQGCKRVCSEWVPEWAGCLSPRSGQLVKEAQKMAARWNRAGLGPWKINMEKIADIDRNSADDEDCGYPIDVVYYNGEVTIVEHT